MFLLSCTIFVSYFHPNLFPVMLEIIQYNKRIVTWFSLTIAVRLILIYSPYRRQGQPQHQTQ